VVLLVLDRQPFVGEEALLDGHDPGAVVGVGITLKTDDLCHKTERSMAARPIRQLGFAPHTWSTNPLESIFCTKLESTIWSGLKSFAFGLVCAATSRLVWIAAVGITPSLSQICPSWK